VIESSDSAGAGEPSDSRPKPDVIHNIRNQEQTRTADRANHASPMSFDVAFLNKQEPDDNQDPAGGV